MKTSGNTILITGGSTGIGFALASSFCKRGNNVVICGRNEEKLRKAKESLSDIETRRCDVSNLSDVQSLVEWTSSKFPDLNVLVNNAGIQRSLDLKKGANELLTGGDEIAINFRSQVILCEYFVPIFTENKQTSAIVNVSSGLAFAPLARFPLYCATKAAIHSFTISLRRQLADTQIKVFEVIPPTVHDTYLKGKPLEKNDYSMSSSEVAEEVMRGLENDEYEIGIGQSKNFLHASKSELDQIFNRMNH
jgi:uncharacterized oxidoreductase